MASVRNIGLINDEKKENERNQPSMPNEPSPNVQNKTPPRGDSYWFAHGGIENIPSKNAQNSSKTPGVDPKEAQLQKEKEERIRIFREQQEEERLKKLKDLEQQFLQAKKHREQQEEERKRRIEEARIKEMERRQQVEERKRQIWEAEQERKEAILRRNMEREARIEARRNAQRMSQSFAFGSSTPRTFDLDLAAIGIGRNTSPGTVLMSSVSVKRSEERELGPPRATSACSLDRKFGEDCMSRSMVSLSSSAFRGRKRTDILPTLTRERSITPHVTPRGKDTSRSPSRPQSSMSGASEISATSSSISAVNMRTRSAPRRPRPYSIAGSVVDKTPLVTSVRKEPERHPRSQEKNAQTSVSKPQRAKSVGREKSDVETPKPLSAPRKPVPPPKSKEVLARAKSHPVPTKDNLRKPIKPNVTNIAKANVEKKLENKEKPVVENEKIQDLKSPVESKSDSAFEIVNSSPITSPVTDSEMCISSEDSRVVNESEVTHTVTESESQVVSSEPVEVPKVKDDIEDKVASPKVNIPDKSEQKPPSVHNKDFESKGTQESVQQSSVETENTLVTPQKPRITSEEEARAALAEKRRLAREQAEREAELERQRQEELRRQEEEKRRIEEQKQREMEQEQIRLAELHRQLEEEKLRKAIEEQQQRQREEQQKREEEARQKAEKEEQERKAREEAERQRIELEERLRKEEEERAERKRRVEQIMARTRGKSVQTPPATTPVDGNNKTVKSEDSSQNSNSSESVKTNIISPVQDLTKSNHLSNGSVVSKLENGSLSTSVSNNCVSSENPFQIMEEKRMSSSAHLPDLLNTNNIANHTVKSNGHHIDSNEQFSSNISVSNSFNVSSSRTLSANEVTSPTQTNGYSSHEDMSCTTSPEETSDTGLLIDVESSQQNDARNIQPADFTRLVEIDPPSLSNDNYLINVDSVNSNLLSSEKPYSGFGETLKKPDAPVDLLS